MKFKLRLSNYPTYRSPIRTFQDLGISTDNVDPKQLRIERKRLLLEIQISETQTTLLGSQQLGKNDVIQLFDELEQISHLEFHVAIFKHSLLLKLLETSVVESNTIKNEPKIFFESQEEWDEFIAFVSPYLANAIDKLLTKVLITNEFLNLEKIRSFFKLLLPQDGFYAFRKFNNFCQTLDSRFENLCAKRTTFPANEVGFLRFAPFYTSVNEIAKFYPSLIDSVASDVINFTVNSERRVGRGKYLLEISDQVRKLHCSAELRTIIINNRDAFANSVEQVSGFNATITWRVLVGIIIIGSLLFRLVNRCDSDQNRTNNFPNQQELTPEQMHIMDQIRNLNRMNDSIELSTQEITPQSGNAASNGFSFPDLHAFVVESAQLNAHKITPFHDYAKPTVFSDLKPSTQVTEYRIVNRTLSDMVMVIGSDLDLTSYFIPAKGSIQFSANKQANLFFYSGNIWNGGRTIEYAYLSKNDIVTKVRFNGYFSLSTAKDLEFLRKLFTLTDGKSNLFMITEEEGQYELYQGDRHVNYSY